MSTNPFARYVGMKQSEMFEADLVLIDAEITKAKATLDRLPDPAEAFAASEAQSVRASARQKAHEVIFEANRQREILTEKINLAKAAEASASS